MNKLYRSLLIVDRLGWRKDLGAEINSAFDYLFERSKDLKDEDLTKEEVELVGVIDYLLEKRKDDLIVDKECN
jgi:hypothetical protein